MKAKSHAPRRRWTRKALQAEVDKLPATAEIYWDYNDELSTEDITTIINDGREGLDAVEMALRDLNAVGLWEQRQQAIDYSLARIGPVSAAAEATFRELVDESERLLEDVNLKGLARCTGACCFVVIVNSPEISYQDWRGVESKGQVDEICELCALLNVNPKPLQVLVSCDNDNRPSYDPEPAIFPDHPERDGHEYVTPKSMLSTLRETSYGGQLVFMLKLDLTDVIDDIEGYTKGPLTIKKGTLGLIFEYMNGAGSCDDMELLKDLTLPAGSFSFELDASRKWCLQSCYAFTDKPWRQGSAFPTTP